MNVMTMCRHLIVGMAAAVSLVALPTSGFAPSILPKIVTPLPLANNPQSLFDRKAILNSGAAASAIDTQRSLSGVQSKIVRALMITFIAAMCVALPVSLFPVYLLYKAKLITRIQKEQWSLKVGQLCSRWLMRLFPFASKRVVVDPDDDQLKTPQPTIWVCNHISMLDLFFMLALDKKMRGKNRRPIKILYWKGLEANPITSLMFRMAGFIPVDMADNGNGNENEYNPKSFKQMLKSTKQAMKEGFDIGILPEGQPNPTPEKGMQPIFSGAFTLARMSRRPIKMMSLWGLHRMWHPDEKIGMDCSSRDMAVRVYPKGRIYKDAEEFTTTFETVAGFFGAHGYDMPDEELRCWLDGSMWQTELRRREAARLAAEDVEKEEENTNDEHGVPKGEKADMDESVKKQ